MTEAEKVVLKSGSRFRLDEHAELLDGTYPAGPNYSASVDQITVQGPSKQSKLRCAFQQHNSTPHWSGEYF